MPKRIQSSGRKIVLAVRDFCEREKDNNAPLIPFGNVRQRVAAITGISEKTVSTITKEGEVAASTSHKISTPRKKRTQEKKIKLDDFDLCAIRNKIHQMYTVRKEVPTLGKLLAELKIDINFRGGRTTLWKIIRQIGFRFKKCGSKRKLLMERRQILYWKGQYDDIIKLVKTCSVCEQTQKDNIKDIVLIKKIPTLPWQIVASDLFELKGKTYLVICDSYSGYLDFQQLKGQSSYEVIEQLKRWFAVQGIPEELQTDNGTQYMSREFKIFQKEWKFNHVTSSPHHHQGNGLAEKAVQVAKNILKKCRIDKSDVQLALLNWRNTPRNDILGSPNQRLYSRITRSPLPIKDSNLKPKIMQGVTAELKRLREQQASYSNKHTKRPDHFEINEKVRHKVAHRHWEGARVIEKPEGLPRSVIIQTDQGQILRRNFSHLHKTQADITSNRVVVPETKYTDEPAVQQVPAQEQSPAVPKSLPASTSSSPNTSNHSQKSDMAQPATALRTSRFGKIIKPVNRLDL
ncbi:uncharacterized protein LOC113499995 [Trichoplusia ni]|uniref:Uncharacterized protein LOC113499995 n=1 Tax=Trichoplusia ni TaxID=7111 RepID=A0A7E5W7G7_TRINI|nr:uncharacterized protein LOC113499995 [Trichoplusia ni]